MEFQKQFYGKVRKKWYKVCISIISGMGRSILILFPTLLMRNIYNSLETEFSSKTVLICAILTFAIPLFVMFLYIVDIKNSKYLFTIIKEIRISSLKFITKLKLRNILGLNYGEIFSNLIQSLSQLGDYYYITLNTLTWYATACVVGVILMLYLNWRITVVLLLITSIQILCVFFLKKNLKKIKIEENQIHAEGTNYLMSLITQNAFIKVTQRNEEEMRTADNWVSKSWTNVKRKIGTEQIILGLTMILSTIRSLYLFFAVHVLFLSDSIMKGDFIAINSYIVWLTPVFLGFQECLTNSIISQINKKRIDTFIEDNNVSLKNENIIPEEDLHSIEVNNLNFSYEKDGHNILNNLSVKIRFGERLYILGASGTGKSTLLNILMNLEDAYEGTVKVNGINIRNLDETWFHRNIVMVGQDVDILPTTLRDNLTYSGKEMADVEIITGLKEMKLENLLSMPGGIDWDMTLHPRKLSDGEKKRLAILRAVLSKPNALLLDEPTAGLDNINKYTTMDYIKKAVKGTLIVVTHDTVYQPTDRVLHLEEFKYIYKE